MGLAYPHTSTDLNTNQELESEETYISSSMNKKGRGINLPTYSPTPGLKEDVASVSRNSFAQRGCDSLKPGLYMDPPWLAIILSPPFLSRKSQNQVECQASSEQSGHPATCGSHLRASMRNRYSLAHRLEDEGVKKKTRGQKSENLTFGY